LTLVVGKILGWYCECWG